ncbi:hypothetical protein [Pseudomonas paracarnis]|uniref:hypothetical protein n=1 Tax=Pseudomonas paracarnis TaxID=2750625 RepID=UPI0019199661|nr:hypothetical protein [Pseudomonas paracarnis]
MTNATTAQATTAPTLPAHIQALVTQLHDLIAVHSMMAMHSQRQIATQLGLSRRRVNDLSKMRPPTTLDMSATTSEFDLTEFNTEPAMTRVQAVECILALAIRPLGVKYHEYKETLGATFGLTCVDGEFKLNMDEKQHRQLRADVRRKAKAAGDLALFIPGWMDASDPVASNRAMLAAAQAVYEAVEDAAAAYRDQFPDMPYLSVVNEIKAIAIPGYSSDPVVARCERNSSTVDLLLSRT